MQKNCKLFNSSFCCPVNLTDCKNIYYLHLWEVEIKMYYYFSDTNWNWVDEETLKIMQVAKRDDGEFWMSFKDFCRHFQEVTICTTGPDFDGDGQVDEIGMYWERLCSI